jgi:hypothetical protein
MDYLSIAIQNLKPNSEFTYLDNDYSTINWIVVEGDTPTQKQIDDEIERIKAHKAQAELDKEAKKAIAQAKLAALGLTEDDLKALGL